VSFGMSKDYCLFEMRSYLAPSSLASPGRICAYAQHLPTAGPKVAALQRLFDDAFAAKCLRARGFGYSFTYEPGALVRHRSSWDHGGASDNSLNSQASSQRLHSPVSVRLRMGKL
jgi:hypothetical protein